MGRELSISDLRKPRVAVIFLAFIAMSILTALVLDRAAAGGDAGFWGLGGYLVCLLVSGACLRRMELDELFDIARLLTYSVVGLSGLFILWYWALTLINGGQPTQSDVALRYGTSPLFAALLLGIEGLCVFALRFARSSRPDPEF